MAKRSYALERGGPKSLKLRWGWGMRNFEVALGASTWKLDRPTLVAGATLVLPDGSSLLVKRPDRPWYSIEPRNSLVLERDGLPIPGSDADPRVIGRRAGGLMLLFGGAKALAMAAVLADTRSKGEPIDPTFAIIGLEGASLMVLGLLAIFGRRLPVAIAAGLLAAEGLVALGTGGLPNSMGVMIQVLVIVHLWRAWKRMEPREKRPSLAQVFE